MINRKGRQERKDEKDHAFAFLCALSVLGGNFSHSLQNPIQNQRAVDTQPVVIHNCITMKKATVRDLRNHFADVATWIQADEHIAITRNGRPFATLSPPTPEKPRKADWAKRLARRKPLGRKLSARKTD